MVTLGLFYMRIHYMRAYFWSPYLSHITRSTCIFLYNWFIITGCLKKLLNEHAPRIDSKCTRFPYFILSVYQVIVQMFEEPIKVQLLLFKKIYYYYYSSHLTNTWHFMGFCVWESVYLYLDEKVIFENKIML